MDTPLDDLLVERFRRCTGCGRGPLGHAGILQVGVLALATHVCASCHRQDPEQRQLAVVLAMRYDSARRPPLAAGASPAGKPAARGQEGLAGSGGVALPRARGADTRATMP